MATKLDPYLNFRDATRQAMHFYRGVFGGELRGFFEKLQDGGAVMMPLEQAPWGDTFGMLTDRFGIRWLVNIAGSHD